MIRTNINEIMFPGKKIPDNIPKIPLTYINGKYPSLVIKKKSPITIIYFHGNNESIYDVYDIYKSLRANKKNYFNFVAPEYAGYSIRNGKETEKSCLELAEQTLKYSLQLGNGVIVVGYSIGSGPATHLCNYYSKYIFGVILINPFLSIKKLALEKVGIASVLVKQRFNNVKNLKQWHGKLITICGKKDNLVDFTHGVMLHEKCPSRYKKIIIHEDIGHILPNWNDYVFNPVIEAWFSHI